MNRRPDDPHSSGEKRLGTRRPVDGVPVGWRVPQPRRWRKKDRLDQARLVDLSVSGAGLLVPLSDELRRGLIAEMELDGCWSRVRIGRVERADVPMAFCGVEFLNPSPAFAAVVAQMVGGATGPTTRDWRQIIR